MDSTAEISTPGTPKTDVQQELSEADLDKFCESLDMNVFHLFDEQQGNLIPRLKGAQEYVSKFMTDVQCPALAIHRCEAIDDDAETVVNYIITNDFHYGGEKCHSIVLIKREPVITLDKLLRSQFDLVSVEGGSPYQTLHSIVSNVCAPYLKSYAKEARSAEWDGDKMFPSLEKKIAEVEMGLLHLQQNIDIPEVDLSVHASITQFIESCNRNSAKPRAENFLEEVKDQKITAQLESDVCRWTHEIQKVTRIDRDPSSGTTLQEVVFWQNLERALSRIQDKINSPEVLLTLEILSANKKFHAVMSFESDTGLKQMSDKVQDYNILMKDFPINDLLSATEIDKIAVPIQTIFNTLRKIRNTNYPIQRGLRLIEAISRDLTNRMLKILSSLKLMHLPFADCDKVLHDCTDIFTTWDEEYEKIQSIMRDLTKKKKREGSYRFVWRIRAQHKTLQARLDRLKKFRCQHDQLRNVISRVLTRHHAVVDMIESTTTTTSTSADSNALTGQGFSRDTDAADANDEVMSAYQRVKEIDVLDISKEGAVIWESTMEKYDQQIDKVEAKIAATLRNQLGQAKNATEMFNIFSRFNALFVRPQVRGAISEYQTQLIERVKTDIDTLREKFTTSHCNSGVSRLLRVRDIPPVSASLIYAKQLERQLNTYMKRVEDVIGKGWENHVEGAKSKEEGEAFLQRLNAQAIFDDWKKKMLQKEIGITGAIFVVETFKTPTGPHRRMRVNFSSESITLYKEVRNMRPMRFRIPYSIVNKAHEVNRVYPYAMLLDESVRGLDSILAKLADKRSIAVLVAGTIKKIYAMIAEAVGISWESYKLESYVYKFAEALCSFQEKVDELLAVEQSVNGELSNLGTCAFQPDVFASILEKIQKSVDSLSLKLYSNVDQWVEYVDKEVSSRLVNRLQHAIASWTHELFRLLGAAGENGTSVADEEKDKIHWDEVVIQPTLLDVRIVNQLISVCPSPQHARLHLLAQFAEHLSVVLGQTRIHSNRYSVSGPSMSDYDLTYKGLITSLPDGAEKLRCAYEAIETVVRKTSQYLKVWLDFQSLWDLQSEMLYDRLGKDVEVWIRCVREIRSSRRTFDTQGTTHTFGAIVVDYTRVQSKVNLKYDSWHKEVIGRLASLLMNDMQDFYGKIAKARGKLENCSLTTGNTTDAVAVITEVQRLKKQLPDWSQRLVVFTDGQKTLERQRYRFPVSWLDVENVRCEFNAFSDILKRRDEGIQNQVNALQTKIQAESDLVETKTSNILKTWDEEKPVAGDSHPSKSCRIIGKFEVQFSKIKTDRDNVQKAKEALGINKSDLLEANQTDKLKIAMDELADMKEVWFELSTTYSQIDELRDVMWVSVHPRKLRSRLDEIYEELKQKPARLRNYAPFEFIKEMISKCIKVNLRIIDLKSESVKERHWRMITKSLNVKWHSSELTLGQVWDADLIRHEHIIKEVMSVAQGEMALEEFIRQISETWRGYTLDMVPYQNKCKIIKGWNELSEKIKEHTSGLSAMKHSPYYKEFAEDASTWEDKLNKLGVLFDVWIDVQRRWVYLDGIFAGSGDIVSLLPIESQRFRSVNSDFLGVMQKVSRTPAILDVFAIVGIQKTLERLLDILNKIQKALGEYLEKERACFPRFYFVGDEDLLEVIGNSKDLSKVQKHMKKMFAGVHSLILEEDKICGVLSREGEEVRFIDNIEINEKTKINEWLSEVEKAVRFSLANSLISCLTSLKSIDERNYEQYKNWMESHQSQLILLGCQVVWTENVEAILRSRSSDVASQFQALVKRLESVLSMLADSVLVDQPIINRKKLEQLMTEYIHQRDVIRMLIRDNVSNHDDFVWLRQMRHYFDDRNTDPLLRLTICVANAELKYGFEYLGVHEKLVRTPLTDQCFLAMTQALHSRLGGSPFGPAGTGKTETVKALGDQMGRFVLVFNCDQNFDFQAMGRIFIGLCQVGAWGCFDEFNRLEERMMSAVSQQIQGIQEGLRSAIHKDGTVKERRVELIGKQVFLHPNMAIFVTMNPGYAGRSNLPDNLKRLFRDFAMTKPDSVLIAQVMLYAQGFRQAEMLAKKIVPFFELCNEQLSSQSHYDFGLRSLKNVLVMAGNIRRDVGCPGSSSVSQESDINEAQILVQSTIQSFSPRLILEDLVLFHALIKDVFPNTPPRTEQFTDLCNAIKAVCSRNKLCFSRTQVTDGFAWTDKILQLHEIVRLNHGIMMVGQSGSGKTTAWRTLLDALNVMESSNLNSASIEDQCTVIDPKSMSKDALYGVLDANTREWKDGLFTQALRQIIDDVRGEHARRKRHWIVFDGDVDPEWVENLNSLLDDNKLLTLPNGERLQLPASVRIMFEVKDLEAATLATVSRCGMIWFPDNLITNSMYYSNFFFNMLDESKSSSSSPDSMQIEKKLGDGADRIGKMLVDSWKPYFTDTDSLVNACLEYALSNLEHVMQFTRTRALTSLFALLRQHARKVYLYNSSHVDFPLSSDLVTAYASKSLAFSIVWAFAGDCKEKFRKDLTDQIRKHSAIQLPSSSLSEYNIRVDDGEWVPWSLSVVPMEIETHKVGATDIIIETVDTIRHQSLVYSQLAEHRPLILCGPPGSGKTMTLFSSLRALADLDVIGLNFSSGTTPELLIKSLTQYCEFHRTSMGTVMSPIHPSRWLVLFCDEINLPDFDAYGTQRVISFIRGLLERGGFYRTSDQQFVLLERIQFVGACNPPTDPGRKPLSPRFLRYASVLYVDYSGEQALKQIYGTFNRAMLRPMPGVLKYVESLTNAMVEYYLSTQERFHVDAQPHYVYSPRELSRWVRGISEAIKAVDNLTAEELVRIWAHEALRLFHDRLVLEEERRWSRDLIENIARKNFLAVDLQASLQWPIMYSNWLKKDYLPVEREPLKDYVKARLRTFHEEELDVPLVLFDDLLDHVLRIDRVFRQPQGHLLMIGVSGGGKTTCTRFVAWINGLKTVQLKVHNKYTMTNFDDDLRNILRRCGCRGEKIAFILDEGNLLEPSFLERMNTLLANGEVPGLFEGDEYSSLMSQCKEGSQRDGLMLDSQDELYRWFANEVTKNLHVVLTMNPSDQGLKDKASTSPALFNRCVLNWFGDWSDESLSQVALELISNLDIVCGQTPDEERDAIIRDNLIDCFCFIHRSVRMMQEYMRKAGLLTNSITITPRHFLDLIEQFVSLFNEKRAEMEEQQLHLGVGLKKISETLEQLAELRQSLALKRTELEEKNQAASTKLQQMVTDQQEAERQKMASEELKSQLSIQTSDIAIKAAEVRVDLERVEPAVAEAKQAVQGIKKQHLIELRSLREPPAPVKLTSESICLLMGQETTDWKNIRAFIVGDGFINTIVNFRTESISPTTREKMKAKYLSNPDFTFDKVSKGSQVCGPLFKWATAQLEYSDMLNKVGPLREELADLEAKSSKNRSKVRELDKLITELESNIAQYKEEYADLVQQAQTIKSDLQSVEAKVSRAMSLLRSLEQEQTRWKNSSQSFNEQIGSVVGDSLICAAVLAYGGYFDQLARQNLWNQWLEKITMFAIPIRRDISRTEYMSTADERLRWRHNGLPVDQLCVENALMIRRCKRYPLIIDPSGLAINYIMEEYKDQKISKTSFLDQSFRKQLESAMRFGNPLLVEDVESFDPILNPVLNKELRRASGRVLITLGDQDIDFSPSFTLFLTTRDPTMHFSPNLCSKVTMINFTVTQMSLQAQCLDRILQVEEPSVYAKRNDLIKLQGEFHQRLRKLENGLLDSLNEQQGRILDDDSMIAKLETLKKEAADVAEKAAQTDQVIAEVEATSERYGPLCKACSSIYFMMQSLSNVHYFYQYSLQFFLDVFNASLDLTDQQATADDKLAKIVKRLFRLTFKRLTPGLLHPDQYMVCLLLCRIFLKTVRISGDDESFDLLFKCSKLFNCADEDRVNELKPGLWDAVLVEKLKTSSYPETIVAYVDNDSKPLLNNLLLIGCVRPDKLIAASQLFIESVFNTSLFEPSQNPTASTSELQNLIHQELNCQTPLLLCAGAPGFDASEKVIHICSLQNIALLSVAMGSHEGCELADNTVSSAAKTGKWVLLKNVHLSPQWLTRLEKKLHSIHAHRDFRLFLSVEVSYRVPANLLRMSRVLMFEPASGVVENVHRVLNGISAERLERVPRERCMLYFLVCWLHGTVIERLRYVPVGWTKRYDFSEADLKFSCDIIDYWIDHVADGRTNVNVDKIPWKAIDNLICDCVYGGSIDNEFDKKLLRSFVGEYFNSEIFNNSSYQFVEGQPLTRSPDDWTNRQALLDWVSRADLISAQSPFWIGLAHNADKQLSAETASKMLVNCLRLSNYVAESTQSVTTFNLEQTDALDQPVWVVKLYEMAKRWLNILSEDLQPLVRTAETFELPIVRYFERELNRGIACLYNVKGSLNQIVMVHDGVLKQTNELRSLIANLNDETIPLQWKSYKVPADVTVEQWLQDFSKRIEQLKSISAVLRKSGYQSLRNTSVNLGLLFTPQGYLTATRQTTAHEKQLSVEELVMHADLSRAISDGFNIIGAHLHEAECQDGSLSIADNMESWRLGFALDQFSIGWNIHDGSKPVASVIRTPVYLNRDRSTLVCSLDLPRANDSPTAVDQFYRRGVAILLSKM